MARPFVSIEIGARCEHLIVLCEIERGPKGHRRFRCRCDCGRLYISTASRLNPLAKQHAKSCGCQTFAIMSATFRIHGHTRPKTPEYLAWRHMKHRCDNPADKGFADYGGRGIRVCRRWHQSFPTFLADMGLRPSPLHQLDRINNDGHYTPNNCRWATKQEQMNNTRRNRRLTWQGRTQTMIQWAREQRMPWPALQRRLNAGWSVEKALTHPLRADKRRSKAYPETRANN